MAERRGSTGSRPTGGLRPRENLIFLALFVVGTVLAVAVDSPIGLVIVGLSGGCVFALIGANVAGFAERAWVSSGWAKSGRTIRQFRIAFGVIGGVIALAETVAGLALLSR